MKWNGHRLTLGCALGVIVAAAGCADPGALPGPSHGTREVRRGPIALDALTRVPDVIPIEVTGRQREVWTTSVARAAPVASPVLDAKLLVLSADGREPALGSIRQTLDHLGVPYTLWIASERPGALTPSALSSGLNGNYQGVILTTGNLVYSPDGVTWSSALSSGEWQALWDYESAFGVRQVSWYTWPTADYGFQPASAQDTTTSPVAARLTSAGRDVFATVNSAGSIPVRNVYAYLARPAAVAGVTPLVTDASGNALALLRAWPDGRQNIAVTVDSNAYSIHALVLSYGLVNWVTRGVFLGERHAYVGAQVDDVFFGNDLWSGGEYRMTGHDLEQVRAWQDARRARRVTSDLRLDMVFNGEGTIDYDPDTLTPAARRLQGEFKWINHTYTHLNLNWVTYGVARGEVANNLTVASRLNFNRFSPLNLVTGEISGLQNQAAMQAAFDVGVRYIVSDSSRPDGAAPTPNTGSYNALVPGILQIPRRPTNLFYNVTTPSEWAGEYNEFYRGYWGRDLSYAEILDRESDVLLQYLLRWENSPWMFHQSNLRAYEGQRSLISDLLDATFNKYEALVTLPIVSPMMDELGRRVASRMEYNRCDAAGQIRHGTSLTLHAERDCTVPVTGVSQGNNRENYGGQPISYLRLRAGEVVTIPLR